MCGKVGHNENNIKWKQTQWNVVRGRAWMKQNINEMCLRGRTLNENNIKWKQTLMNVLRGRTLMKTDINEMCWEVDLNRVWFMILFGSRFVPSSLTTRNTTRNSWWVVLLGFFADFMGFFDILWCLFLVPSCS